MFDFIYSNLRIRKYLMLARAIFFLKILKRRIKEIDILSDDVTPNTIFTNKRLIVSNNDLEIKKHPRAKYFFGISLDLTAVKSSWVIKALKAIPEIYHNIKKQKVLIIGPRNEAEIFNFRGSGFLGKNITAIDLISYSPLIQLGDMHNLEFSENSFDIVYAGWVIAYSENKIKAIDELVRVVKNGKFIAIGWSVSNVTNEEIIKERGYMIGSKDRVKNIDDILKLFNSYKYEIVFSSPRNLNKNKKNNQIILILQIQK